MVETLFKDSEELQSRRFSCSCCHPNHILDIYIENWGAEGRSATLCLAEKYSASYDSIFCRISKCLKILFGKELFSHDIIIREEDIQELKDFLEKKKRE